MASNLKIHLKKNCDKTERLSFLKERYKKLILDPRKEIESEIEKESNEEDSYEIPSANDL